MYYIVVMKLEEGKHKTEPYRQTCYVFCLYLCVNKSIQPLNDDLTVFFPSFFALCRLNFV